MDLEAMISAILKQATSAEDLEELGNDYLQVLVERRGLKCDSIDTKVLARAVFDSLEKEEERGSDSE
jgi:hypothetical protein